MTTCILHACAASVIAATLVASPARASDPIPQPLDRAAAIRIAVERSHARAAARASASASRAMGDAERRLPDPEIMAEAWQVPIQRPLAFGDASMVSVSVKQSFPAPGVLSSRGEAREAEARVGESAATDRARAVERDAAHAFVDAQVAQAKHASHVAHRDVAGRLVAIAEARLASGAGRLSDVAIAEVERARLDADVAVESAMVERARARMNGLLRRDLEEPLVTTPLGEPETVALDATHAAALARENRAELGGVRARRDAEAAIARAAKRESSLPTFTVGAGWYAPTSLMPFHGYGVSVGATLPWVWGSAAARARAGDAQASAATEDLDELETRIRTEAATALADVHAASRRVAVLRARAKPAADAALEVAVSAYQAGQTDASSLFRAEKDVVEIDVALVSARADLAHALAELDWAAGGTVPRVPLAASDADVHHEGGAR